MSIKQQGGVFGRNPTFNDVDVDGSLTTAGPVTIQSSVSGAEPITMELSGTPRLSTKVTNTGGSVFNPGGTGIFLSSSGVLPSDGSGNANNGVVSLGASSLRFRFLFLSDNIIMANGKGIDFSATSGTGTSELFDDYEEGTWTPELRFGNATTGIIQSNEGYYTKVGRLVTLSFKIVLTSKGTATGSATITGLPFSATVGGSGVMGYNLFWSSYPANGVFFNINSGNNFLNVGVNNSGGSASDTNFANNTQMNNVTLSYLAG